MPTPEPVGDSPGDAPARHPRRTTRQVAVRGALVLLLVVALGVGGLLLWPDDDSSSPAPRPPVPVSADQLLEPGDVQPLAPRQSWSVEGTGDNTSGDGLNTVCQQARFADPDGEGTLVRRLVSDAAPARSVLQTVEVSGTTQAASDAYRTTLGWFAGCREARLRVADAWRVEGLGARSQALLLESTSNGEQRTYLVGVARSDRVTLSLVAETTGGPAVGIDQLSALMQDAVARLCVADATGFCPAEGAATVTQEPVPPSGETPGALAAADLPPVGQVDAPWVGTSATPAQPNPAATSCDATDFVAGGAPDATTRTFLIPEADLPPRFGLTQTLGTFPGPPRARALVDGVVDALAGCEDEDLSAQVTVSRVGGGERRTVALWRLEQEVNDDRTVASWMGVARVGRHVTQVLFTPAGGADLDEAAFTQVMQRAADRLTELTGTGP